MTAARPPLSTRLAHGLLHALAAVLLLGCAVGSPPARSNNADGVPPPGRVGKIGLLSGPVTRTDLQSGEREAASLNWPVTSGTRLSTGPLGRAEVRIGSIALRMDGDSDVDFNRIDDELVQIVIQRGTAAIRARNREVLPEIDLVTPRERIVLDDVGRYRIDVDRAAGITALTAFVGSARIASGRMTFNVRSGQRGEIGQMPGTGFTLVNIATDTFDDWVASRDRRDDSIASTRYVSPETTGVEALDEHGTWRTVPEYGAVWYPSAVPVGWVPYRYGRWAYVAPWGWTWIDDAPWGFAPFHYGRWAYVSGGWAWVPGAWVARPIYAPALVAWYGAPGVSVSVGFGSVGWFPLGPREVYVPWYGYNRRYITGVNIGHVGNIDYGRINPPPTYVHQSPRASTWVPNDAIVRQQPIKRVVQSAPSDMTQFVARPTPPAVLNEGIKRRTIEAAPGDAVRAAPRAGGAGVADAPVARPLPAVPGAVPGAQQPAPGRGKFDTPMQPGPAMPSPGRGAGEAIVRPMPAPVAPQPARPMPTPRDNDDLMVRKPVAPRIEAPRGDSRNEMAPRPEITRPMPPRMEPPARIEPPRVEQAPAPRAMPPKFEQPGRGPQADIMVRPAPRMPEPVRAEPPQPQQQQQQHRGEPPRGGKFQREQ